MPGRIIDALKRAGVDDPVIVLDEIDKMEADWRGDPAAALMEVLDPVQNRTFRDNYLELEYDLSHVFFIATANYDEDIPETLLDRLEIIRLPGYTDREKLEIAARHLMPKIAEESGLSDLGNVFTPAALRTLIREYTREAGVREMARLIGKVYRRLARMKVEGKSLPRRVGPAQLARLVGPAPFLSARLGTEPQIGRQPGSGLYGGRGRCASHRVCGDARQGRFPPDRSTGRDHAGERHRGLGLPQDLTGARRDPRALCGRSLRAAPTCSTTTSSRSPVMRAPPVRVAVRPREAVTGKEAISADLRGD